MNQHRTKAVKCTVCGAEAKHHAGWFLVAENRWLDHLKILSWHPVLADQREIQSVCSEEHLKVLLNHWLSQANLDLKEGLRTVVPLTSERPQQAEPPLPAVGELLGELAVHRQSLSRGWTGSAQTLECILRALTGREAKIRAADYSLASLHAPPAEELVYRHSAGRA